jgi:hypothetical protein
MYCAKYLCKRKLSLLKVADICKAHVLRHTQYLQKCVRCWKSVVMCAVFFTYWAKYVDKMHKELNSGYNKVLCFVFLHRITHF